MTLSKEEKKERKKAYENLPTIVKEQFTEEEKDAFLNEATWPDSMFDKLKEFLIDE